MELKLVDFSRLHLCPNNAIRLEVLEEMTKSFMRSLAVNHQVEFRLECDTAFKAINASKRGRVSNERLVSAIKAVQLYMEAVVIIVD